MRSGFSIAAVFAAFAALAAATVPAGAAAAQERVRPMCGEPILLRSRGETQRLVARYMGTTSIFIDDGETPLLVDPFFSRPSAVRTLLRRVSPHPGRIGEALRCAAIKRVTAIFVTHAHIDHSFDAPTIAHRFGAEFVGSTSSAMVAGGGDVPKERIHVVLAGDRVEVGDYDVDVFDTPHGFPRLYPGKIEREVAPPARAGDYREGGSFSFLLRHPRMNILVHPATNFSPGQYRGVCADVVFLSIAMLGLRSRAFAEDYWREVVTETGARLVVPVHWDNFTARLTSNVRMMNMSAYRRAAAIARRERVAFLRPSIFAPIDLDAELAAAPPRPCPSGAG